MIEYNEIHILVHAQLSESNICYKIFNMNAKDNAQDDLILQGSHIGLPCKIISL